MITSIAVIVLALFVAGFVKGLTGLGLPLVAIPVMATFIGVEQAILTMALPSALINGWQAVQLRKHPAKVGILKVLAISSAAGVMLGATVFTAMPSSYLTWLLAAWISLYLLVQLLQPQLHLTESMEVRITPWAGVASGIAQATTGIPGPIVATYLHALGTGGRSFAFMASVAFATLATSQLIALQVVGLLEWKHLGYGAISCLPALIAMHWANQLAHRLSDRMIKRLILTTMTLLAVKLAYSASLGTS